MNYELLRKTINHFGEQCQKNKAIEELGELVSALSKEPYGGSKESVISEIADVKIVLAQLELMYLSSRVKEAVDFKLQRLESRLIGSEIMNSMAKDQFDLEHYIKQKESGPDNG